MAKLENKNIRGLVGNVVFRTHRGKQVLQSYPSNIKQTKATKSSASEFGKCSSWGKQLRLGLAPFLLRLTDTSLTQRFTARLYNALNSNTAIPKGQRTPLNADMSSIAGLEFNIHSPFASHFLPEIATALNEQQQIVITIPAFEPKTQLLFPEETEHAELLLYIYATNFDSNSPLADSYFVLPIEQATALQPKIVWTSPALPENYFVLVSAKLMYYTINKFTVKNYINSKELNPAMVLMAVAT